MFHRDAPNPNERSERAYRSACAVMPGGVNSPVRAFKTVGGVPRFIARGRGPVLTDIDGNDYIDYVGSWGPLILGHADPRVVEAVVIAARDGLSFGAPTEAETRLATLIVERMPAVESVRFVNSGTEAVMTAVRLARAHTGRSNIVKCSGCYHGHADGLLVDAGSGALTLGTPSSPGVTAAAAASALVIPYNDLAAAQALFDTTGSDIAAFLVEPVAGNMGCVPPSDGYLAGLAELCRTFGALLVFDEVMTGFRIAPGGARERYDVKPDLTCLGKIIGGGAPLAAYGGRRDIMNRVSPAGDVYQAGTLAGNPLATAAGVATLEALKDTELYAKLEIASARLEMGLRNGAAAAQIPITINRVASMLTVFFTNAPVTDLASAQTTDRDRFARFFHAMLERGVYLPPSPFECWFVSTTHADEVINQTIAAAEEVFHAIADG